VIRRVSFRAFVAVTEDEERVREALSIFLPLDSISFTSVKGHFGNEIKMLEASLKKKDSQTFFQILREQLPKEELIRLRREIPDRVDEENRFHMRLDKQSAYKGLVRLTEARDAIDVSAMVETYPARREKAVSAVEDLL
jgi:RNA binding exosome subunit